MNIAERIALDLGTATAVLLDDARTRRHRTVLDRVPVVVARSDAAGGSMQLHRPGQAPLDADPVPVLYALATAVARSHAVVHDMAASALVDPSDTSWREGMAGYAARNRSALAGLGAAGLCAAHRDTLAEVLRHNVAFLDACLTRDDLSPCACAEFGAGGRRADRCAGIAATVLVEHWMGVLDRWRTALGPGWADTYVISACPARLRRRCVQTVVLTQFMGPETLGERLLLVEAPDREDPTAALLDDLVWLLTDHTRPALLTRDHVVLDTDQLGGAGEVLAATARRMGLDPLASAFAPVLGPLPTAAHFA